MREKTRFFENLLQSIEYNKTKRRVRIVIPALWEENLAKFLEENEKKIVENPCQVGERRKVEKLFENDVFEIVKELF